MKDFFMEINILEDSTNQILCNARLLLDEEDGWFEGITNNNEHLVFGMFERNKAIDLYRINLFDEIDEFFLKKSIVSYNGKHTDIQGKTLIAKMNAISLEKDPRDLDSLEKEEFIIRLRKFKEQELSNQAKKIVDKYYNSRNKLFDKNNEEQKNANFKKEEKSR